VLNAVSRWKGEKVKAGRENSIIRNLLNFTLPPIFFIHSFINCSIALCWALAAFSSFIILYRVSMTPWTGDQTVARPLPTHRTAQTE
jgi:hypothetical protein